MQADGGVMLKNADTVSASSTSTAKDSTSMAWHFVELCTEWSCVCCLPSIPAALQVSAHSLRNQIYLMGISHKMVLKSILLFCRTKGILKMQNLGCSDLRDWADVITFR